LKEIASTNKIVNEALPSRVIKLIYSTAIVRTKRRYSNILLGLFSMGLIDIYDYYKYVFNSPPPNTTRPFIIKVLL
jgi:hypothetical protein